MSKSLMEEIPGWRCYTCGYVNVCFDDFYLDTKCVACFEAEYVAKQAAAAMEARLKDLRMEISKETDYWKKKLLMKEYFRVRGF